MSQSSAVSTAPYQVLARKYRPKTFHDLVGQEGLVDIFTNIFKAQRFPHAVLLTGMRGVGKTTTARLLARGLNCVGPDGKGKETITPCGICAPCQALLAGNLLDVIEMDAASRTGVDDVRDIIEAARYKPLSARYKIYIIDEVHMLSKSAFDALLKTLEEPPAHVKFIFATTERHKIPETVLSRCMRFNLQRVSFEDLKALLERVAKEEGFQGEEAAFALLARAGDGSARDSLSLLDQALSLSQEGLTAKAVRQMLHLADDTEILLLLKAICEGHPQKALTAFTCLYDQGSDPHTLLEQMLAQTHQLQMQHVSNTLPEEGGVTLELEEPGHTLSASLSVPVLARLWQGLLKGYQEVKMAPDPSKAAHMVLIRLCYLAELPTPGDALARLLPSENTPKISPNTCTETEGSCAETDTGAIPLSPNLVSSNPVSSKTTPKASSSLEDTSGEMPDARVEDKDASESSLPETFEDLVALVRAQREPLLAVSLRNDIHVLAYKPGFITLYLTKAASKNLVPQLKAHLEGWTNSPWQITVSQDPCGGSPRDLEEAKSRAKLETFKKHPLAKAALDMFPDATVQPITP